MIWRILGNTHCTNSCPNHTKISIWFKPWNCRGLGWKIDIGPPLFILLQLGMPINGVKTGQCDQPLNRMMLWTVIDFKVCKMKWVEISFVMRPSPKWMAEPTNLIILVLIFLDHPKVNTCSPGRSYNQLYNIVSTFYHYYVNPTLL